MLLGDYLQQPQVSIEEIQPKKTYPQVWASYNKAQTTEKSKFQELLFELCSQIDDFPRKDGAGHDHPHFEPLVKDTAKSFSINEVSADKAYLSAKNLRVVANHGGMPYIPFKENSRPNHQTKDSLWKNMYYYFQMHKRQCMNHYHKRSNVETVFSMIKGKFGERLKSKTEKAQINELLCKILCHNLCCVIQSLYELDIEVEFYRG